MSNLNLVELGYISKAFGIKGAVVISLFNNTSQALRLGLNLYINNKKFVIRDLLNNNCVFFEEITDRNMAERLHGAKVYISRADLPEISHDEVYLQDLLGLQVYDINNNLLGEIVSLSNNNIQDLAQVKTLLGHLAYIPLVSPILVSINLEENKIIINPPEGLLEPDL